MLKGARQGDTRALHRARIASRRLREVLPILRLDRDVTRKLNRRLRKVTRRLGAVRELDVMLLLIDELHVSRREHRAALSRIGVAAARSRDAARRRLFGRRGSAQLARVVKKLGHASEKRRAADEERSKDGGAERARRWAVDARVARRASRLHDAIADAGAVYLPDRLHEVRLAIKKLRYALELSLELAGQRSSADVRVLKRGQDVLGRMHDLQGLADRARQVQASLTPPNLMVWRDLDALVDALEDECRRLHARYMRLRDPLAAIAERLSARRKGEMPHTSRATG